MKKLCLLCLLFLLLGNTFDGLITYRGVQVYGIEAEANDRVREIMENRGLGANLVDKLVFGAIGSLFWFLLVGLLVSTLAGWFHGYVVTSFLALLVGMSFFFAGLTWLTQGKWHSVCYRVPYLLLGILVPMLSVYLILLYAGKLRKIGGLLGMSSSRRD